MGSGGLAAVLYLPALGCDSKRSIPAKKISVPSMALKAMRSPSNPPFSTYSCSLIFLCSILLSFLSCCRSSVLYRRKKIEESAQAKGVLDRKSRLSLLPFQIPPPHADKLAPKKNPPINSHTFSFFSKSCPRPQKHLLQATPRWRPRTRLRCSMSLWPS